MNPILTKEKKTQKGARAIASWTSEREVIGEAEVEPNEDITCEGNFLDRILGYIFIL